VLRLRNVKSLIIFVLFLPIPLHAFKTQVAGDKHEQPKKALEHEGQESQKPQPTVSPQQAPYSEPGEQKAHGQRPDDDAHPHDWVDRVNAFSTLTIAAFTVLLFFAAIWQTRTNRETERAWIIASPIENAPDIGFVPAPGDPLDAPGRGQKNSFACSFKSTGNTPARLVESAVLYRKIDRLEDIEKEPDYEQRGPLDDLLLVKGDSIGAIAYLYPEVILLRPEAFAVNEQKAFLYAFGIVVYRDVYDRLHETRFGYVYHIPLGGDPRPRGFRREGLPPAYNKAT
jgi:hypothetical protein